jgi:hypothetical protein
MSTRTFHDRHGDAWRVRQVPGAGRCAARGGAGPPPDERADGSLAFDGATGRRLFHPIPPRWMEYSDDELRTLCRLARPARTRGEPART